MKAVFSKYLLFVLICFCFVIGVKGQKYEQLKQKLNSEMENGEDWGGINLIDAITAKFPKEFEKDIMFSASVYNYYGNYLYAKHKPDSALGYYTLAVNTVHSLKADTSLEYALYLSNAAYATMQLGYYELSDRYYNTALYSLSKFISPSSEEYTEFYKRYAELKVDMKDYGNAQPMVDNLLNYYKVLKGDTSKEYFGILNLDAMIKQGTGDYWDAIDVQNYLLYEARTRMPPDTMYLSTMLNNLAYTYRLVGENEKALSMFLEAYALEEKCSKADDEDKASLLNNLGIVYKAKCDYVNAEKVFLKSIQLYEKAGLSKSAEITNPCNNLGDLYRLNGNLDMADYYLNYAIQVRGSTSGKESEAYANALINRILLLMTMGQYAEMEQYCLQAKEIYKKVSGVNSLNYANTLMMLSNINSFQGKYDKALIYADSCLNIIESIGLTKHEYYLSFLRQKADILFNLNLKEDALVNLKKSMDISESLFGNDNYNTIECQAYYAKYAELAEKGEVARKYYLKSISKYESIVKENMSVMGEEEKSNFYLKNSWVFSNFESFVIRTILKNSKLNDDTLLTFLINERLWTKSILLNESSGLLKEIANNKDTTIVNLYYKWIEQKKYLQVLYQLSNAERDSNKIDLGYETAVLTSIEKGLMQGCKEFTNIKRNISFKEVKSKLQKNERAIEMIKTSILINDSILKDVYAAIIIGADFKVPKVIVLDSSDCFDSLFIERYKFNIHSNKTDLLSYNRYFKPLEKYLNGVTKIYFSPDGVYQQMNIYTLYDPIVKKYLIEKMEVEQVTSLNDLQKEVSPAATNLSAVLFGYPDYEWKKDEVKVEKENLIASRFGFSELPELPGTKKETEEIFSVFNANKWDAKLYLAKQATEEQVKSTVSPTILHIATHGFFLPNLDYSDEKILGFETESAKQNPLLRSGVIMAGAASKDTTIEKKEDGILTAYEASLLNLQNTELVTLSACETGLGDQGMNGQGVYGLQRAFLTAGAKSVLMSLWVVDDNATKELMTNFYSEWIKNYSGSNKRSSFRKAQLEVKKRYPSPYYWGAFVMIGK